ncbi:hypothetical protein H9Y04_26695 [Streptomyces sp. TRM66268-LWL]|uniref:Lipoprotein n=1 Tax=Streptomyces polyasparticus TaxID=2767826 RepID=A0ABR7SKY2_9ACTN|nr:hypothetical protein [Streptomyces polyasparticus]MBC9716131.1 hypothetical protein [Streptomyces polyasparticus]
MNRLSRRTVPTALAAAALAAVLLGGCGNQNGLAEGTRAPDVSEQPHPRAIWPAWSESLPNALGDGVAGQEPPPALKRLTVPKGGFAEVDVRDVLRADPDMRGYARLRDISGPGRSGIRPPRLVDLTGDGHDELVVAVDTSSGRTVVAVYTARDGKAYRILKSGGQRLCVEAVGSDLLLRTPRNGGENAVRYHWNGVLLAALSDTTTYPRTSGSATQRPRPGHTESCPADNSADGGAP